MGLRSCLNTEGIDLDVSRRLKRLPTIEDKLRRLPTMDLSSMQDIGGCRAVLATQEQVQQVVKRFCRNSLRRNKQADKIRDYVASPKSSGYRAIHIYTRYHDRRIEVQLRTREQDSWAKVVELLTSMTGIDFKNGDGPDKVHELLRELSAVLSMRAPGQPFTEAHMDILTRLARLVATSLHQGPVTNDPGRT
ncbi:MAG: RelA/SpoT domain-containing protein [bacterium]|nr:RelA/SpoT domain-containing protein [bacterium]